MKNNFKFIIFIIIAIAALYFATGKYSQYSREKSISACIIAQKNKSKDFTFEEAKKYCESEINK
tara:strand:+ start:2592 stop:2783 length:192 start_codon:yes stop_codon:yes gene_type:complete